jgi:hypothetical protein
MAAIPEKPLEELIHELPPDLRQQVRDFVEFLLEKRRPESPTTLRQDWAGALEKYREKKALAWRGD